jgi:sugar lactone lactonase YvrE
VDDARVVEGDSGSVHLEFQVHATGPPSRLELAYALSDRTASAAAGDYSPEGGVVSLTPRPARLMAHWGSGHFAIPQGVALAPNGDVLAVDGPNGRIHRFSRDGALLQTFGVEGSGYGQLLAPTGIAVDAAGEILVSNFDGRVNVYTVAGQCIYSWGGPGSAPGTFDIPFAIAVDAGGYVYVSDVGNNRIQKFSWSKYGTLLRSWNTFTPGEPENDGPLGIAVDAQGYVYAAKAQSGRILKFAPDGTLVATWTDTRGFCSGRGLCVDGAGNLLIADAASSRVVVLDKQGTFLTEWMLDDGPEQNPGEFSATGIVADRDGALPVGPIRGNDRRSGER